jgi:hypothetical protein
MDALMRLTPFSYFWDLLKAHADPLAKLDLRHLELLSEQANAPAYVIDDEVTCERLVLAPPRWPILRVIACHALLPQEQGGAAGSRNSASAYAAGSAFTDASPACARIAPSNLQPVSEGNAKVFEVLFGQL